MNERPSWDSYFIQIVGAVAQRATCDRGRCAALLVRENQIISTGYVGSPPGFAHCDDVGHLLVDGHCVRTVHAEQNALASAARAGVAVAGSTCYTKITPCRTCAMLLVTAGIDRVVSLWEYQNRDGLQILVDALVPTTVMMGSMIYEP